MAALDQVLDEELARLDQAGLRRQLRRWTGAHGPWIDLDGRRLSSFSSNNYLGLAGHPALAAGAGRCLEESGVGAAASRLIAGNHREHEELERELAAFHHAPAALLFNSGFQANVGTIPALVGPEDLILSDRLNHASLIDGCRLSRAAVEVFPHRDVDAVRRILAERRGRARHTLVVTDAIFSMDGDRAPLEELAKACQDHEAWLLVDEAHAVGVVGPGGRGLCAELGVVPEVRVGTLGKAFGSFGAYAVGSEPLRQALLNRARSFIFSTGLPPAVVGAARAAVQLVSGPEGERRRAALQGHIDWFCGELASLGLLAAGSGDTAIVPVLVGEERAAVTVSSRLFQAGIHAQAVRPPTVPRGTSRLRFALMSEHEPGQLADAIHALGQLAEEGLLRRP